MSGVKRLRKIQLGKETTAGTAVPATTIWRGVGTIEDLSEVKSANENIGILPDTDRPYIPMNLARLALEETEATFEQLILLFAMGIKNVVSGTADGAGSGKIWTFPVATIAQETVKTFTFEGGDDQQAEEFAYGFVEEFTISGAPKQALMMSASVLGRQVSPSTFTAALTPPTVEEILFGKGSLAIDLIGGTMGATVKANTLLGFKLNHKTGFQPVWAANGYTYFPYIKQVEPVTTLEVTFEHDATSVAEKVAMLAKISRQLQLQFVGEALTTPAGETVKRLTLPMAGHWEKITKLDEIDGNDVLTGTFKAGYNATAAKYFTPVVVNEVASI